MKKTSIHFEPCNVAKSEKHNKREQELDYIFPELSYKNEGFILCENLVEHKTKVESLYKNKIRQKMQTKTVPIREAVVVIDESTTMDELKILVNDYCFISIFGVSFISTAVLKTSLLSPVFIPLICCIIFFIQYSFSSPKSFVISSTAGMVGAIPSK